MIINMHIYTSDILQVYIEGHFQAHIGTDLVVMGEAKPICFKVSKSSTLQEFKASLAKQMVCVTLSTILVLIMMWRKYTVTMYYLEFDTGSLKFRS